MTKTRKYKKKRVLKKSRKTKTRTYKKKRVLKKSRKTKTRRKYNKKGGSRLSSPSRALAGLMHNPPNVHFVPPNPAEPNVDDYGVDLFDEYGRVLRRHDGIYVPPSSAPVSRSAEQEAARLKAEEEAAAVHEALKNAGIFPEYFDKDFKKVPFSL